MRINGFDAKELWIRGCETDQYQCYKPDIYCLPNVNGIPKCHIIGLPRNPLIVWMVMIN